MSSCAPKLGQVMLGFVKPARHVSRVFIHCSAASRRSVDAEEIDRWHTSPPNNWSCIGYHYFIRSDGVVECGRSLERNPSAQRGHNAGTIAICLNGLRVDDFTKEQFQSLRTLCQQIDNSYLNVTFHGHTEVSNKSCPVFDYRKVLNLDQQGIMRGDEDLLVENDLPTLGTGDTGTSVQVLQKLLEVTPVDGVFGHDVSTAVTTFQTSHRLTPDGIVGNNTWRALIADNQN